MSDLLDGQPFALSVSDHSAYYMLSVRPLIITCSTDGKLHEVNYAAA